MTGAAQAINAVRKLRLHFQSPIVASSWYQFGWQSSDATQGVSLTEQHLEAHSAQDGVEYVVRSWLGGDGDFSTRPLLT